MNEDDPYVRGQTNMKTRILDVLRRRKLQLDHQLVSAERTLARVTSKTPPATVTSLRSLVIAASRRSDEIKDTIERISAVRRETDPRKK